MKNKGERVPGKDRGAKPVKQPFGSSANLQHRVSGIGKKPATPLRARYSPGVRDKENCTSGAASGLRRSSRLAVPSVSNRGAVQANRSAGLKSTRKLENDFDELQAHLATLKRQSIRPSISGIPAVLEPGPMELDEAETQSHPARPRPETQNCHALENCKPHSLAAAAARLAQDESYRQMFDKAMTAQLQRTKDGATDRSRITELAGLVKLLRRCLKEADSRLHTFVAASLQHEKNADMQVEGVRLTSESARRQLEAQLASLKRDAAQAAASKRAADVSWQAQVDTHRAEASHARQELQRFEAERDRARDEVRRAEAARSELEGKEKGLRREAGQQRQLLESDRGEALRQLQEAHEDKRQAEVKARDACAMAGQAGAELKAVHQALEETRSALGQAQSSASQLESQLEQAHTDLQHEQSALAEAKRRAHDSASCLAATQGRYDRLLASQGQQQDLIEAFQQQSQEAAATSERERQHWEQALAHVQDLQRAAEAREASLGQEKGQLKTALAGALEQKASLEASVSAVQEENLHLQAQVHEAQALARAAAAEADARSQQAEQAGQEGQRLALQLHQQAEAQAALEQQAAAKAARLARMEGELEALQDAIGTGSTDQAEMLGRLISRVAHLDHALAEAQASHRLMHNQLVELRGNVRVFCRLKPASVSAVASLPDGVSVCAQQPDGKDAQFSFDRVFDAHASQASVFQEVSELVQSALDGYQVCLFAYGQTGSGKTYTMQGPELPDHHGIIPRALAKILEQVQLLQSQGWEYELLASHIEVYNETLRDLLAEGRGRDAGRLADQNAIKHDREGGHTTVAGATRARIATAQEASALMRRAARARAVEATAMNAESSRSHSAFMLHITGRHAASDTRLQGALNLVDLAGSERLAKSGVEGQRAKEACLINKSLSSLGDVFAALAAKSSHIPHRNSKLTHLLQPCLGGAGKTLMVVNINPEPGSLQESLCTLRFAAKVNGCETAARGGAQRHVSSLARARPPHAPAQGAKGVAAPGALKRKAAPAAAAPSASKLRR